MAQQYREHTLRPDMKPLDFILAVGDLVDLRRGSAIIAVAVRVPAFELWLPLRRYTTFVVKTPGHYVLACTSQHPCVISVERPRKSRAA